MVQNDITLAWALTTVAAIFSISVFFLLLCGSWEEIVEESRTVEVDFSPESQGQFELSESIKNDDSGKNQNVDSEKSWSIKNDDSEKNQTVELEKVESI